MKLRCPTYFLLCFLLGSLLTCIDPTAQAAPPESGSPLQVRQCGLQTDNSNSEKARQQIGISVQQQMQLERLYADADKKEKALEEQLHDLYDQQRTLYDAYFIDHTQERDLRKKIAQMHVQILLTHADTEEKLRKILTHEQFDRLSAVLRAHRRDNLRRGGRRHRDEKDRSQHDVHI